MLTTFFGLQRGSTAQCHSPMVGDGPSISREGSAWPRPSGRDPYWTGSLGSRTQAAATLGLSGCSSAVKEAVGQLVSVTPENNEKIASGVDRSKRKRLLSRGRASVYWQPPDSIREGERAIRRLQQVCHIRVPLHIMSRLHEKGQTRLRCFRNSRSGGEDRLMLLARNSRASVS